MALDTDAIRSIIASRMNKCGGNLGGNNEFKSSRTKALKYYFGEQNSVEDNAGEGEDTVRSVSVSRDVAEVIDGMMPALMRTFAAGDDVVKCVPEGDGDDTVKADQSGKYINYVLKKNNAFLLMYDWLKSGALSRLALVKAYWHEENKQAINRYNNLTPEEAKTLDANNIGDGMFDVVADKKTNGYIKIEVIPPEEVWIDPNAKTLEDSPIVAHGRARTISEIREDGFEVGDDDVENLSTLNDEEVTARDREQVALNTQSDDDPSMKKVLFFEAYSKIDILQNGIAQLYKIFFIGEKCSKILYFEACDEIQFADWTAIRMPHRLIGKSIADDVAEIQEDKTFIKRAIFDNAALQSNPRKWVQGDKVNLAQLQENAVGQIVLVDEQGAIEQEVVPPIINEGVTVLGLLDAEREARTGFRKFNSTLDGIDNAYQTSATGAEIVNNAANDRAELIARGFAETGFKKLAKLILNLGQKFEQDTVLFNKELLSKENFNPDLEINIDIGLGANDKRTEFQRAGALFKAASDVLQAQSAGLMPKFLNAKGIYEVIKEYFNSIGFKNHEAFLDSLDAIQKQASEAQPQPDPQAIEAQQRMQLELKKHQDEIDYKNRQLEAEQAMAKYEIDQKIALEREKMAMGLATSGNINSGVRYGGAIG